MSHVRRIHEDARGVIVNWLFKLLLGFAVVAVVLFDGGSIVVNSVGLDSAATEVANAVSVDIADGSLSTPLAVEDAARQLARTHDARLISAEVDDEGVLRVTLRRRAPTLIVSRVSAIEDWALATATGQSGTRPK